MENSELNVSFSLNTIKLFTWTVKSGKKKKKKKKKHSGNALSF